jgi:hypothetical protein
MANSLLLFNPPLTYLLYILGWTRPELVEGRWSKQDFGVSSVERSTNVTAVC